MSPEHREPDGTRRPGPTWEILVERKIREAMEAGAFQGPCRIRACPCRRRTIRWPASWGLAYRMLKDAGAAPPWSQADKEAHEQIAPIEALLAWVRLAPPS